MYLCVTLLEILKKELFSQWGGQTLEQGPTEVVGSPSFEIFGTWLDKALSSLIQLQTSDFSSSWIHLTGRGKGGLPRCPIEVPDNLIFSMILCQKPCWNICLTNVLHVWQVLSISKEPRSVPQMSWTGKSYFTSCEKIGRRTKSNNHYGLFFSFRKKNSSKIAGHYHIMKLFLLG